MMMILHTNINLFAPFTGLLNEWEWDMYSFYYWHVIKIKTHHSKICKINQHWVISVATLNLRVAPIFLKIWGPKKELLLQLVYFFLIYTWDTGYNH